jgi:hypothetical protein
MATARQFCSLVRLHKVIRRRPPTYDTSQMAISQQHQLNASQKTPIIRDDRPGWDKLQHIIARLVIVVRCLGFLKNFLVIFCRYQNSSQFITTSPSIAKISFLKIEYGITQHSECPHNLTFDTFSAAFIRTGIICLQSAC